MKIKKKYVLDWQDEVGRSEPLHSILERVIRDHEAWHQNSYLKLGREEMLEYDEGTEEAEFYSKVFEELDKFVPGSPDEIILLINW